MKFTKSVFIVVLSMCAMVMLAGCSNDRNEGEGYYSDYCVVEKLSANGENLTFLRDDGVSLVVERNSALDIKPVLDQRVLIRYSVLSKAEDGSCRIHLNGYYDLLSKPVIRQSFIDLSSKIREDSVGHDPISIGSASFSGDYLNIVFVVKCDGSSTRHLINLVLDDSKPLGDTLRLTMRHNDFTENNGVLTNESAARASFKLTDLMEGKESMKVRLSWKWYDSVGAVKDFYATGTFAPKSKTGTLQVIDDDHLSQR